MRREDFLKAISMAGNALGRGDIVPSLACLWFDGETVSAFDENVGISTPCPIDLQGGIKGDKLIGTVAKTRIRGAEVTVTTQDAVATIKVGKRVTMKVALVGDSERKWSAQKPDPTATIEVNPKLLVGGLEHCLKSVGQDLSKPEFYGVTFEADKDKVRIYTGYTQVLVEAIVPVKSKPKFNRVILPAKFCQHLVRHINSKNATLELHDSGGFLAAPELTMYGRPLGTGTGTDIAKSIAGARKGMGTYMELPIGIGRMLDRAALFEGEHLNMKLDLERRNGGMRLRMVSGGGAGGAELVDVSNLIDADVEPIKVHANAKHLLSSATLHEFAIHPERILIRDERGKVRITQVVGVSPQD